MSPAYILAQIRVPDADAYAASGYPAMAERAVAAFGGRFLVRGGNPTRLEGQADTLRTVILEFPSRQQAEEFHRSALYAPAIALRQSLSVGTLTLLDGYVP